MVTVFRLDPPFAPNLAVLCAESSGSCGGARERDAPDPAELYRLVATAEAAFDEPGTIAERLGRTAEPLEQVDGLLRGVPGVQVLIADPALVASLEEHLTALEAEFDELELGLDTFTSAAMSPAELEAVNAALVRARDAAWAVRRDRLRTARAVAELAGPDASIAAIEAFLSVQIALAAIDRLEVRGRDSAGLHLLVRDHDARARRSHGAERDRCPGRRSALRIGIGARRRRRRAVVRVQGRGGDRRAR